MISSSWGECETAIQLAAPGTQQVENYLFEEAAAQGQTVFAASGDTGSDDCAGTQFHSNKAEPPYLSVDDPASQPDVVGVGGTSLLSDVQPLANEAEHAWNDGANGGGGGGGISESWASPSWQADSGVPGIANPTGRLVPDVSADADEDHGITIYQANPQSGSGGQSADEDWLTIGGTSGAAPMWAAIVADIASSRTMCPGLPSRPRRHRPRIRRAGALRRGIGELHRRVRQCHRRQQRRLQPRSWLLGDARLQPRGGSRIP